MGKDKKKIRPRERRRHTASESYNDLFRTPARQILDVPPLIRSERTPGRMLEKHVKFGQEDSKFHESLWHRDVSNSRTPVNVTVTPKRLVPDADELSSGSSEEISLSTLQTQAIPKVSQPKVHVQTSLRPDLKIVVPNSVEDLQAQIVKLKQAVKEATEKVYTTEIMVDLYRNRWLELKTHLS